MIDNNKIQQGANQYIGYEPEIGENIYVLSQRKAFIEGVKWFKNAL